jgi:hypothetical protein
VNVLAQRKRHAQVRAQVKDELRTFFIHSWERFLVALIVEKRALSYFA